MPSSHTIPYIALHYIRLHYNYTTYTCNHMYVYVYIYIHIYLRVCVCLCVYPHFVGSHPALGKFLSPMFETRSKLAQNSGIKLYVGEFGPGLSKFRQPKKISACTTLKQSQRHRGPWNLNSLPREQGKAFGSLIEDVWQFFGLVLTINPHSGWL